MLKNNQERLDHEKMQANEKFQRIRQNHQYLVKEEEKKRRETLLSKAKKA
jgi:hypothetical protein